MAENNGGGGGGDKPRSSHGSYAYIVCAILQLTEHNLLYISRYELFYHRITVVWGTSPLSILP